MKALLTALALLVATPVFGQVTHHKPVKCSSNKEETFRILEEVGAELIHHGQSMEFGWLEVYIFMSPNGKGFAVLDVDKDNGDVCVSTRTVPLAKENDDI